MKILFIADPLDSFKIYKDTTYTMMVEAHKRGHTLFFCEARELMFHSGAVSANVRGLQIVGDQSGGWYACQSAGNLPLTEFDAVLLRTDPPFDMEYVTTSWLLEIAERAGARIFNKPQAIRDHSEKLAIGEFPQFVVPTLVTRSAAALRAFHGEHRDVILKPLDGMGGMGIFRVRDDELNLGSIIETLGDNGTRTIMAQRYIPEIKEGDKRILLIGGKPVPFALARIPQGTEVRGNLAVGGVGRAQPLSPRDKEIADTLAPVLFPRGLLLVGLDVIGNWLTEVNVTSPTGFREIMDQTGCDVAALYIDALETASGQA